MARKKVAVKTKQKESVEMKSIKQLHACILKDCDQLDKIYKKMIIATNKTVAALKKSLAQAKQQVIKTKAKKKTAPGIHQKALQALSSLQLQLHTAQTQSTSIEAEYIKFIAKEKAVEQFEKTWGRKKLASPKKKKTRSVKTKVVPHKQSTDESVHNMEQTSDALA